MSEKNIERNIIASVKQAKAAAQKLSMISTQNKNAALQKMAKMILAHQTYLIRENKKDLQVANSANYSKVLVDRLVLNEKRIKGMAQCLLDTARLKDPVGETVRTIKRPNGLIIKRVRTPIGLIGIIYESRPNVTSDCIGLCLKSGNAVILKGGKEAFYSNQAIFRVLKKSLISTRIPTESIQLIKTKERRAVYVLLKQDEFIDLIVPRGGESLIRFVAENSMIPVIKHYKGVCHTYVSDRADLKKAVNICFNAKVQRPGVCNAMETMLVHQKIARTFLPVIVKKLQQAGVEIRGCPKTKKIIRKGINKAKTQDWYEEYLDLILSIKVVGNLKEAVDHINKYGSKHSDAIVTRDQKEADIFFKSVDSACLYLNASTRFTDGYEFGFGAEVGISTDKLHARGPMALEELTTYKYTIIGKGQIRN